MAELTVYDSEGTEHAGPDTTGGVEQRVRDLFYDSIRLAVEPGRRTTVYVFFRARATENARAEQYYGKYVTEETGPSVFPAARRAVESRVATWGHSLETAGADAAVFRELTGSQTTVPGSKMDRDVLRELADGGKTPSVGVADERAAIRLAGELADDGYAVAVRADDGTASYTDFDSYLTPGEAPAGELSYLGPETEWDRAHEEVRSRRIDAEIDAIRGAVQTLTTNWELSPDEARARVTDGVPELAPARQSDGLFGGGAFSDSSNVREAAGLFGMVAVFAVILVAAGAVGFGPLSGVVQVAGSDSSPSISMDITGGEFRANETVAVVVQLDDSQAAPGEITVNATADGYARKMAKETGENGVALFELRLPQNATTARVEASLGDVTEAENVTVRPADPARLALNRSEITVGPNETVSVTVHVTDEFQNVVSRADVEVTARSNATVLRVENGAEAKQTAKDGTVTFTLDPAVANTTTVVSVTAPGLHGDTLDVTIQQSNASLVNEFLRDRAAADPGTTLPLAGGEW